jgi:hypothetical protein
VIYGIDGVYGIAACTAVQPVLETSIFTRRADALLSHSERLDLIAALAKSPQAGDLIPGLGGIRKLRFARWAEEKAARFG